MYHRPSQYYGYQTKAMTTSSAQSHQVLLRPRTTYSPNSLFQGQVQGFTQKLPLQQQSQQIQVCAHRHVWMTPPFCDGSIYHHSRRRTSTNECVVRSGLRQAATNIQQ